MKKIFILLTVLGINLSCAQDIKIEDKEKFEHETLSYELQSVEGEILPFEKVVETHRGKTIFIDVWASWCPDCLKSLPEIKKLQAQFPEVTFLFLSVDKTPESWKKGLEKYEVKGENFWISDGMKGVFGKSINLDWIPRYMIIDKEGKLVMFKAVEASDKRIFEYLKQ